MNSLLKNVIEDADYWRGAMPAKPRDRSEIPYKEWQHFVVFGPDWVLVFNLNLDAPKTAEKDQSKARIITIFSKNDWRGYVEQCSQAQLHRGSIDAQFNKRWHAVA